MQSKMISLGCPNKNGASYNPGQSYACADIGQQSNCPGGYRCQQTSRGSVCCDDGQGSGSQSIQCPLPGQVAQTENGAVRQCQPSSSNCGLGYDCVPALNRNSIYICCTSGGGLQNMRCPIAGQQELLDNGIVRQCQPNSQDCGFGYVCIPALHQVNAFICCSSQSRMQSAFQCPIAGQKPLMDGDVVRQCQRSNPNCGLSHMCMPTLDQPNLSICCSTNSGPQSFQCPIAGQQPLMDSGVIRQCQQNSQNCGMGYICMPALDQSNVSICCSSDGGFQAVQCPIAGQLPLFENGVVRQCQPNKSTCGPGYNCLPALNRSDMYICCSSNTGGYGCK